MKKPIQIIAKLLCVACLMCALIGISGCGNASSDANTSSQKPIYIAFSSDVHNDAEGSFSTRLSNWLDGVSKTLGGVTFSTMGFCGDYGSWSLYGDDYWVTVQKVMDAVANSSVVDGAGIFARGNHEYQNGYIDQMVCEGLSASSFATARRTTLQREALREEDYVIYCFGAYVGSQEIPQIAIHRLRVYLQSAPKDRPIFILSHFPLHSAGERDASAYADKVISVLNEAAEQGCNIVFLWGHNHSIVGSGENHYDCVLGDYIDATPISFLYAAVGCMGDNGGTVYGKGLVAEIADAQLVSLNYYDVDAAPTGAGYRNSAS